MTKYKVTVTETLCRDVLVEAADSADALDQVRKLYRSEEIILDADAYVDTDFEAEEEEGQ